MTPDFDPWKNGNANALEWAEVFCGLYPAAPDPDTMLGWFANAIEIGRAVERKTIEAEAVTAALDALAVAMVRDPVWHTVTNSQRDTFLRLVRHAHPGEDTE